MDIGAIRRRSGLSQTAFVRRISRNMRGPKVDAFILARLENGEEVSKDRRSAVEEAIARTFPELVPGEENNASDATPGRPARDARKRSIVVETKRKRVVVPKADASAQEEHSTRPVGDRDAEREQQPVQNTRKRSVVVEAKRYRVVVPRAGTNAQEEKSTRAAELSATEMKRRLMALRAEREREALERHETQLRAEKREADMRDATEADERCTKEAADAQEKEDLAADAAQRLKTRQNHAVRSVMRGHDREALAACEEAETLLNNEPLKDRLDLNSVRIRVLILQAMARAGRGDLQDALASLEAAAPLFDPSDLAADADTAALWVSFLLCRTRLLVERGDIDSAQHALREVKTARGSLQSGAGTSDDRLDAEIAFCEGLIAVACANWPAAIRILGDLEAPLTAADHEEALQPATHPSETALARGDAFLGQGDLARAKHSYLGGIEHLPVSIEDTDARQILLRLELLLRLGDVALKQGNAFEVDRILAETWRLRSAQQLRDATAAKAASARIELLQGILLRQRQKADLAKAFINRAQMSLRFGSFHERADFLALQAEAELHKAEACADLQEPDRAASAFQGALDLLARQELCQRRDLDEMRLTALIGRGVALARVGSDEALTAFDEAGDMLDSDSLRSAREFHPMRARLRIERGALLAARGRLEPAAACYESAESYFDAGGIDGWLPHSTLRFRLYALKSELLKSHRHDQPQAWYRKVSGIMSQLLELAPPDAEAWSHWATMRTFYRQIHADWLRHSVRNGELAFIPEILAAVQGRETATEVQDRQGTAEPGSALQRYSDLRNELRTLAETRDLEAHQRLRSKLERLRAEVAREPGFELLAAPHRRMRADDLRDRLEQDEAMLLLFSGPDAAPESTDARSHRAAPAAGSADPSGGTAHAVLFRKESDPVHFVVPELMVSTERLGAFAAARSAQRGMRRGAFTGPEAKSAEPIEGTSFWTELEALQRRVLWEALAPHLAGLRRIIGITHGPLHLLGLTAGAPEGLEILQYPGLVFFALKRGLYASSTGVAAQRRNPGDSPALRRVAVLAHDGDGSIPMAAAEGRAVARIWQAAGDVVLVEPCEWPDGERLNLLHVASHGSLLDQEGTGPQPVIELGQERRITETVIARGVPVDVVFLNICLGGRSSDDPLDGSPSGLVSGFLRAGAKVVIAALPPVPDLLAFVLGLLVTHELASGERRAEMALARAKEKLATGNWPETLEPIFRDAFEEVVVPRIAAHVEARARPEIDDLLEDALTAVHRCEAWWFDADALTGLEAMLHFIPGADDRLARITDALTVAARGKLESAIARRIPPPADLGLLRHGVIAFGETE